VIYLPGDLDFTAALGRLGCFCLALFVLVTGVMYFRSCFTSIIALLRLCRTLTIYQRLRSSRPPNFGRNGNVLYEVIDLRRAAYVPLSKISRAGGSNYCHRDKAFTAIGFDVYI
jgi:hypothetical protein